MSVRCMIAAAIAAALPICRDCMAALGRTGADPYDYKELVERRVRAAEISTNGAGRVVADFGKDAVGWLELDGPDAGPYEIVLGELVNRHGEVTNEYPRSSIRCQRLKGVKPSGRFRVPMPADSLNLRGYDPKAPAILLPEGFGVVFPFRYAEVVSGPRMELCQVAVNYPIDMGKSAFSCDSEELERVYELCKYTILATSFCGVYVDGDRERTPYEADAYINQLSHYAIDDDGSLARKSHEWLMEHPTWPTEWRQHSVMMAWADWMWTGDTRSIAKYFDRLASEKLMTGFARASDGLLETGGERGKGARPGAADIVDWPHGERDGFQFRPVNAVVNAFFYRNLREMADIARALGKDERTAEFASMAERVRNSFQAAFYRPQSGLYADGEGTDHCSLHANAAALAFGLVPEDRVSAVADFLESKEMACSVYFAQYLLEALFEAGRAEAAVRLMTSRGNRSWLGMADFGSTILMEAWNIGAKPNLDLNHAWGSAPLNIIARRVAGVTPIEPGFRKIAIRPQLGGLGRLSATVPTVAGPVALSVTPDSLEFSSPSPTEVEFAGEKRSFPPGRHRIVRKGTK
ncbi:MAG: alpha-L-rhamnosidase [Kiritimatiellae bacterium]|nr:alpha-L-rhamnosidase [Kiritimatiellia bacterium]